MPWESDPVAEAYKALCWPSAWHPGSPTWNRTMSSRVSDGCSAIKLWGLVELWGFEPHLVGCGPTVFPFDYNPWRIRQDLNLWYLSVRRFSKPLHSASLPRILVRVEGFEPPISCSRSKRGT